MNLVETIKKYGGMGCLTYFPAMIKKELIKMDEDYKDVSKASADNMRNAKITVRNKFLAVLM